MSSHQGPGVRRSSYASVLSGTAGATAHSPSNPRSGFLANTATNPNPGPNTLSHSLPPHYSQIQPLTFQDALHGRSIIGQEYWDKGQLPAYSVSGYPGETQGDQAMGTRPPDFFVPSYLRGSRHIEKLDEKRKARLAADRHNGRSARSSNTGSLSTRTSSSNLHKMIPSHRGMTHEIIERPPPHTEETVAQLPSRWSTVNRFAGIEVFGDGAEIKFTGTTKSTDEGAAVKADHPMPSECGIYYFEVTVLSRGKDNQIAVGFSGPNVVTNRLPGWESDSWAYHGDDGHIYCQTPSGRPYGHKFGQADVIGCGINYKTLSAFFTRNGHYLGIAFRDIRQNNLYPSVGVKKPGEHIRVNFGQSPFVYDIDGMFQTEKKRLQEEIDQEDATELHKCGDESVLGQDLVAQYLSHDGFVETARAFSEELRHNAKLLRGEESTLQEADYKDDVDAINRQSTGIRSAILDGNVDKALKWTNAHYTSVLSDNENIYFKLRCRKFIEMIRRCTDLQSPSGKSDSKSRSNSGLARTTTNGHSGNADGDHGVFDEDMELDDAPGDHSTANGGDNDTEMADSDWYSQQNSLMGEALRYGQELQSEFKDDPRREVKQALEDTFALIAYPNAKESSLAPLLETDGRIPVAEELNSAILVSLGKSSNAVLERLCQQTEVLLNDKEQANTGAAMLNLRRDYLRQ